MFSPRFFPIFVSLLLGFILGIPSNICIVIVNLASIRKKEKLSPSDVIFLAKGIVNFLLQVFLTLQGMIFLFYPEFLFIPEVYALMNTSVFFLIYFSIWLTSWLSIHYCTSITNLSYRFFIWLKGIVSNFLSKVLILTALGLFIVSGPRIWAWNIEIPILSSENSTEKPLIRFRFSYPYVVLADILSCFLPFCLSLLCFAFTFSFLLRHIWRVKNIDSVFTRPNLRAHVTALRTIFFQLLVFTFFSLSEVLSFFEQSTKATYLTTMVSWNLQILSPLIEAFIIFHANNKLKRIILRMF